MKQNTLVASLAVTVLVLAVALVFALRPRPVVVSSDGEGTMSAEAQAQVDRSHCQGNLKQMSLAVAQFTQDNDERFPDLSTPSVIQSSLSKYLSDVNMYSCPTTKKPYQGNAALSGKKIGEITNPARIILFYETDNSHLEGCNVA